MRTEPLAIAVRDDGRARGIVVELNKGTTITVPIELLQGLEGAASRDLDQMEILGQGIAIAWPKLDQQFSIAGLIAGVFGTRAWMAKLALRPAKTRVKSAKRASRAKGGQRRNTSHES